MKRSIYSQLMNGMVIMTAIVAVASLTGCATVPKASPEFEQQARSFTPAPGKAAVYVYRPYNYTGSALVFPVSIDYKEFGTLANNTYLFGNIDPGSHIIRSGAGMAGSVRPKQFDAEAGKLYFFKVEPGWDHIVITPVDESEGRQRVSKYQLSGDNVFEMEAEQHK